jgi:GH24 family phage-related lysozyme (muramidase)
MSDLKNRSRFIADLKRHEGFKDHVYEDHLHFRTFGYGHKITRQDPEYSLPLLTKV